MGILIDETPAPPSKELQVAARIDQLLDTAMTVLNNVYLSIQAEIVTNPAFISEPAIAAQEATAKTPTIEAKPAVYDAEAVYMAFEANTQSGFTRKQLDGILATMKAMVNYAVPEVIVDGVAEPVLELPMRASSVSVAAPSGVA